MWINYYDILRDEFSFLIIGIILFLLSCFFIVLKTFTLNEEGAKTDGFIMRVFGAICCFIITVLVGIVQLVNYFETKSILDNQNYMIAEGTISKYVSNKISTKLELDTIKFEYSNNKSSRNQFISSGKYVRIHYYEGEILRLWVWEEAKK